MESLNRSSGVSVSGFNFSSPPPPWTLKKCLPPFNMFPNSWKNIFIWMEKFGRLFSLYNFIKVEFNMLEEYFHMDGKVWKMLNFPSIERSA